MKDIVHLRVKPSVCSVIDTLANEKVETIFLEKPKQVDFGDFSTNIAMVYAKKSGLSPRLLAEKIKREINENDREGFFSNIDIAGPGFINLFVSQKAIIDLFHLLLNSDDYLHFQASEAPPVIIEFVSANPTGPLHVGHGRGAAFGDSLARILRYTGRDVTTEYYVNDVGNQIEVLARSLYLRYLEEIGRAVEFPDDHYKGGYLKDIARELKQRKGDAFSRYDEKTSTFFADYAMEKILQGIHEDLEKFSVHIDIWFGEKTLYNGDKVDHVIETLREKGFLYEKDGALWFRSTDFGDDKDRVIVRANRQKTYFASDIAYHMNKTERGYGELIDVWGADHHGYVPRLTAAMKSLGFDNTVLKIILVQFVTLIRGGEVVSMSTRGGQFETLRDVLDEVGSDAARFFYLTRSANSHLDFDIDLAKETTSDNPVYYVQYAHARICSLLRESKERDISLPSYLSVSGLDGEEEMGIMKKILEFKDVIVDAAMYLEPHRIPFYLIELSKMFHSYYNRHRFLTEDKEITMKRIALALGVKKVVATGLGLIGVSQPVRM